MLEFIHNFGSKVFNFFSTNFGNEGAKRQRDGLYDELPTDYAPIKRFRLDMEPDWNVGQMIPKSSFSDLYFYREDKAANSKRTAQPLGGRMPSDSLATDAARDSRLSSAANPTAPNPRNPNSSSISQQVATGITVRDSGARGGGGGGFNFSRAHAQVSSGFQFTSDPDSVKFQGSSRDAADNWTSSNRSIAYNQPTAKGVRCDTPRLNGAKESKQRSVFSRIICGGSDNAPRGGVKCIDTRRRNKMAVKQCIRMNEKNMYQDLLNRHMTRHVATPALPSYSVERHNGPTTQRASDNSSALFAGTPLFDRSGLFSSTRLNDLPTTDSIKHRLDVSTSLLTSAVTTGRGGQLAAPLPAWRQTMTEKRKPPPPTGLPERTLQVLQQLRCEPVKAPPRNVFEKQSVAQNNRVTDNSLFFRKSSEQSERRRSESPITIGSERRSSKDSELEVLDKSPEVNDSSQKENLFDKSTRSPMPEIFERTLMESRYAKKDFMLQVNSKTQSEFAKQDILETETAVKYYRDQRSKSESQLINQVQNLLRISERLPVPLEETYVEEEPEEEEEEEDVCEIVEDEEEEEEDASTEFTELTEEQESVVNRALVPRPSDQILVEGFRLQIARKDLATLSGLNWLNDEIINFYLNLIMERSEKQGSRKVYAFSTFFYPKVKSEGHKGVRRWTKAIDLFRFDYVLVPVHLGMHWCLAVVDFRKKQIRYYDSMGGNNEECLRALRNYLSDECQAKRQTTFDWTDWQFFAAKNIPQQMNGSDCGMFACKFAEYISRDAAITFDQRHMPYFRRRMVYEILTKTLM